ncbi:ERF family protein [Streptomyces sp. NBC_00199]|uniref:ERF family protein n=1 Tax=Streptomyces sp. NBC_00199 TaxID=2975678 RepID=UPI00224EE0CB|nr:ERF family protein [Streptomyces sp. NBC_00199]MCX5266056.1 ERF family protein [Streptomyces sp. NBC_00199]
MTVTALPLPTAPVELTTASRTPDVVYVPAPEGAPADQPRVFTAISAVMRDAMPVGKDRRNEQQNYAFRGIDDVMSAMAGPMRAHGVFILPTIADHQQQRDGKMTRTLITMRYRIYGPAGDCLIADVPGEAFDYADKATNKAQSAALKYLMFTLFMLPVDGRSIDDGDRHHPEPPAEHQAEQQQRQQRQQDRRQQRGQQRQQQPRRGQRAESGPWDQQAQPQGPRPDYTAEAKAARTPEQFDKVRADAVAAGASAEFLAHLDAIAANKRAAAQPPGQATPNETPAQQEAAVMADVERARAAAEERLRITASRANLPTLDADFERAFGKTIAQAQAVTLDAFRKQIEAAAGGAQ